MCADAAIRKNAGVAAPESWLLAHWRRLVQARHKQQLAHAILIYGPRGLGKRRLAAGFVRSLFCSQPDEQGMACGLCRDCRFVQAGTHPDALSVCAPDGAVIRIDDIREMNRFLYYTGQRGFMRVALIDAAENMNLNAANSILKTLEEPPPGVLLILLSDDYLQVAATVRSRCLALRCCYPQKAVARSWLQNRLGEQYDVGLLLALAQGAPLLALQYADESFMRRRHELWSVLQAIAERRLPPAQAVEQVFAEVRRADLRCLLSWQIDMVKLKLCENTEAVSNPDLKHDLLRLARCFTLQALFCGYDQALALYHQAANSQLNRQLQLEAYLNLFCQHTERRVAA